jgi:MoaA/NifB/PqqE/SkfB family radical SAM enzyme
MWKEWLSPHTTFNVLKPLAFKERLGGAINWLEERSDVLLPPITVEIHPTNLCNVNCSWCNVKDYRTENLTSIPDNQLLELPKLLSKWGVKSIVLSGGEPLLHPKIAEFLNEAHRTDLQVGLKTNGVNLSKEPIREAVLAGVDWVGISIDAATAETYMSVKKPGIDAFEKVLLSMKWLSQNRKEKKPFITAKFLVHHQTYTEQYIFCDLVKSCGADEVHIRPLYLPRYRFPYKVRTTSAFYLREARKMMENETFHIYGIVHKVEREWTRAVRFQKCYATPLRAVLGANGKAYLCADRMGDSSQSLGRWYPFDTLRRKWGSKEHRELVSHIAPSACPLCSLCDVNEVAEKCLVKDSMFLDFV